MYIKRFIRRYIYLIVTFILILVLPVLIFVFWLSHPNMPEEIIYNLLADLLFFGLVVAFIAYLVRNQIYTDMIEFFKLGGNGAIEVFMSEHIAKSSELASFKELDDLLKRAKEKENKKETETIERLVDAQRKPDGRESIEFQVASPAEILEFGRLRRTIERPELASWLPLDIRQSIESLRGKRITLNSHFSAKYADYKDLATRTVIFIGSARANHGTFYFLYGEKAGLVRFRTETYNGQKNAVELINPSDNYKPVEYDSKTEDVGFIQRFTLKNTSRGEMTIFYLSGATAVGTAAACAILRTQWKKLHEKYPDGEDFAIVFTCNRETSNTELDRVISGKWDENVDYFIKLKIPVPRDQPKKFF